MGCHSLDIAFCHLEVSFSYGYPKGVGILASLKKAGWDWWESWAVSKMAQTQGTKRKICYYYKGDVGNYYYGQGHPMKPHWIHMIHNLLLNCGLYHKMEIYCLHKAKAEEMSKYHSDEYFKFLCSICPDNLSEYSKQMQRFNIGEDCPIWLKFCQVCLLVALWQVLWSLSSSRWTSLWTGLGSCIFTMVMAWKRLGYDRVLS